MAQTPLLGTYHSQPSSVRPLPSSKATLNDVFRNKRKNLPTTKTGVHIWFGQLEI